MASTGAKSVILRSRGRDFSVATLGGCVCVDFDFFLFLKLSKAILKKFKITLLRFASKN